MLSELEPSEFDTPIPFSPFIIIVKLEMASGAQLPTARNISPVIASGIENVWPGMGATKNQYQIN